MGERFKTTELGFCLKPNSSFAAAVEKITQALKADRYGVLTEIDVQVALKQKLNVDFRRYTILGACNPPLAHRAPSANLDVGLLLPGKITVYEEGDGAVVTAVNPVLMLGALRDDQLVCDVAEEAKTRLQRAITSLSPG